MERYSTTIKNIPRKSKGLNMKRRTLVSILFCMLSINNAHALLFSAVSDEMVHNRSNGSPFGTGNTSNNLAVVGTSNYNLHSFIKFDISSFTNAGIDAASVSLNLFTSSNQTNILTNRFQVFGLNEGISQTWSESTKGDTFFNGTNFPGLNNDATLSPSSDTTLLHGAGNPAFTWGAGERLEISNSTFVNFINNDIDGILTFILIKPENTGQQIDFLSRTSDGSGVVSPAGLAGDFAPQLNIQAVPVPAAVWLLGSSLIGLFSFKRKV